MSENRIETTDSFKELLPASGDMLAVPMITDAGLWHHLNIKLPAGGSILVSVPEAVLNAYPEYFKWK